MPSPTIPAPQAGTSADRACLSSQVGAETFNVLIGCEYSATERDAFRARGFNAFSCDLKACDGDPRWHIQGDIRHAIMLAPWDAIILHLDCTKMAVCGNTTYAAGKPRHPERIAALDEAEDVVRLALSVCQNVAVENPASVIFPMLRERLNATVQYIHPWQHGHPEQKKTGLALWGLPLITETNNVYDYMMTLPRKERERIFFMSPSADRGHERSRAYPGIANAFADQWGDYLLNRPSVRVFSVAYQMRRHALTRRGMPWMAWDGPDFCSFAYGAAPYKHIHKPYDDIVAQVRACEAYADKMTAKWGHDKMKPVRWVGPFPAPTADKAA